MHPFQKTGVILHPYLLIMVASLQQPHSSVPWWPLWRGSTAVSLCWLFFCVFAYLETNHQHVFWDARLWQWNSECTSGASMDVVVSVRMSAATWNSAGIHFHAVIKKPSWKIRTTHSFTSNMHVKIILLWSAEAELDYFCSMLVTKIKLL